LEQKHWGVDFDDGADVDIAVVDCDDAVDEAGVCEVDEEPGGDEEIGVGDDTEEEPGGDEADEELGVGDDADEELGGEADEELGVGDEAEELGGDDVDEEPGVGDEGDEVDPVEQLVGGVGAVPEFAVGLFI